MALDGLFTEVKAAVKAGNMDSSMLAKITGSSRQKIDAWPQT